MLVSGSGSNLQALIDSTRHDPSFPAQIVLVLSDRPGVRALERAAAAGIPTEVIAWTDHPDREAFTKAVCDAIDEAGAEVVVLAGFMRILASEAIRRYPHRILNVHPALLPAFPGARAVEQALEHGVKVTGVTVHLVDEQVDHGPIVSQHAVEVHPGDDPESLHQRLQAVEHRLLPEAVRAMCEGRLQVEGRTVQWR